MSQPYKVTPEPQVAGVAMALILGLGGFIFYNTNIVNEYRTADERGAPQAEYEKRYRRYEDVPQPTITGAELRVEIYPDEAAVDLRGSYRLVNRTGTAIDSVHVLFADPDIQSRSISFDPAAEPVPVDDEAQYPSRVSWSLSATSTANRGTGRRERAQRAELPSPMLMNAKRHTLTA